MIWLANWRRKWESFWNINRVCFSWDAFAWHKTSSELMHIYMNQHKDWFERPSALMIWRMQLSHQEGHLATVFLNIKAKGQWKAEGNRLRVWRLSLGDGTIALIGYASSIIPIYIHILWKVPPSKLFWTGKARAGQAKTELWIVRYHPTSKLRSRAEAVEKFVGV